MQEEKTKQELWSTSNLYNNEIKVQCLSHGLNEKDIAFNKSKVEGAKGQTVLHDAILHNAIKKKIGTQ